MCAKLTKKGVWSAMRSTGSVVGGAINFSTNYSRAKGGGIAWATYLIFVGFGKSTLPAYWPFH
jgi:predicted outer membrane repeat protein